MSINLRSFDFLFVVSFTPRSEQTCRHQGCRCVTGGTRAPVRSRRDDNKGGRCQGRNGVPEPTSQQTLQNINEQTKRKEKKRGEKKAPKGTSFVGLQKVPRRNFSL